jgi:hypothetical protein
MKRQKDIKTRIFAQKLIDDIEKRIRDSREDFAAPSYDDFCRYSNKEIFKYLDINYADLIDILEDLKKHRVIFQYECLDTKEAVEKNKGKGFESYRTTGFSIERAPKYEECVIKMPDDFFQKAEIYLARPSDKTETKSVNGLILYFDQNGNLWHGNKDKNCYPMSKNSERFFIFEYLVDNKGFQNTESITTDVNAKLSGKRNSKKEKKQKTSQNVRTEIGKMRRIISNKLDIDDLILTGGNDNGYGLNPKYKIVPQK